MGNTAHPTGFHFLQFLVVPDDFTDDEGQEFLGEFGIQIGLFGQRLQPFDLGRLAGRVRWRKVVLGLQPAHGLGVLEAFGQRVDQDRVQPVDRQAVVFQQAGGFGFGVHHCPFSMVSPATSGRLPSVVQWRRTSPSSTSPSRTAPSRSVSRRERVFAGSMQPTSTGRPKARA